MREIATACLVAGLLLGSVSPVFADALLADPEDESPSADAETAFRREGFAIGVGMGPALFLGAGEQSYARGGGASLSVRLGTSAGDNLLWFVQLDAAGHGQKSGASLLGIGAHYYFRDALWVRGGLSLATVVRDEEGGEKTSEGSVALVGGIGVDVFRRGIFALDLELGVSRAGYKEGSLTMSLLQLMANWY